MGLNFYLKSPKEQTAPLEFREESGIEHWLYNQMAILRDASAWKWEENTILLFPSSKGDLSDCKSKYTFITQDEEKQERTDHP